jgi:hypothetical protein
MPQWGADLKITKRIWLRNIPKIYSNCMSTCLFTHAKFEIKSFEHLKSFLTSQLTNQVSVEGKEYNRWQWLSLCVQVDLRCFLIRRNLRFVDFYMSKNVWNLFQMICFRVKVLAKLVSCAMVLAVNNKSHTLWNSTTYMFCVNERLKSNSVKAPFQRNRSILQLWSI